MRILHFLVTDRLSGAENVHLDILRYLKDSNEVYYVSPDGPIREVVEDAGVNFIPCDTDNISEIKRVYREISPDIVHACDPRMSFKCAVAGIPFIAHLHCNCPWLPKLSANSVALRYTVAKASAVIAVSESIPESYIFGKAMRKKLFVLPNTVDSSKVLKMAEEQCGESFDVIFVGRMNEYKRPLLFLEFVKKLTDKLPSLRAAAVGDGEMMDDVKRYISENGIENVKLFGFNPNPYKIIGKSKINVFTSSVEGFGLVAVESMILGKPVLAFPVGGLAEIADRGGVLCNDSDEMVRAAQKLLTDKTEYSKLSEKAKNASARYTDMDGYISKIKEIYCGVLKSK